jgi:uncharacterized protein
MAGSYAFNFFNRIWYDFDRLSKGKGFLGGNMIFIIILLCFAFLLVLFMLKEAFANRVICHDLYFSELPTSFEKFTIFLISDIHRRRVSDKIISQAIGKADMVIIAGDLTEGKVPIQRVKSNIEKLKRIGQVYFVWGNNDYEVDVQLLKSVLLAYGVHILDNESVKIVSKVGEYINLMGIDDVSKGHHRLDQALINANKSGFRLLVSHNPAIISEITPEQDIHLILSGHTHGGQIRIFGFGPYEKGGIKKIGRTTLFVSNGYGTTALPLRLGAKAETHLLTLKPGDF